MQLGFGRLRLSPLAFWAMTPRELAATLPQHHTLSTDSLRALMQLYPDSPEPLATEPHHAE